MSEPLRLAFVVEGMTDFHVLKEIAAHLLDGRDFEPVLLQPETNDALHAVGDDTGLGWPGVYRWCREAADQGDGRASQNFLVASYDALIVHLDAQVARERYANGRIVDAPNPTDLPCEQPCPPPGASTDPLRAVMLGWMGEVSATEPIVLCTPSKELEAWIVTALYPDETVVRRGGIECHQRASATLSSKPKGERLVSGNSKNVERYRARAAVIAERWPAVCHTCTEADRFNRDLAACLRR